MNESNRVRRLMALGMSRCEARKRAIEMAAAEAFSIRENARRVKVFTSEALGRVTIPENDR